MPEYDAFGREIGEDTLAGWRTREPEPGETARFEPEASTADHTPGRHVRRPDRVGRDTAVPASARGAAADAAHRERRLPGRAAGAAARRSPIIMLLILGGVILGVGNFSHSTVETTASAGMPSTQTCMNCHSQIWNDSPYLEPVRASFRENKPIEWERVHDLPEFAYFNHSIHIAKGVGCSTCHGQIDNMPAVYQENTLQMEWCLAVPPRTGEIYPAEVEIFNMQWQDGDLTTDERLELKEKYKIRRKEMMTSCSTCHR